MDDLSLLANAINPITHDSYVVEIRKTNQMSSPEEIAYIVRAGSKLPDSTVTVVYFDFSSEDLETFTYFSDGTILHVPSQTCPINNTPRLGKWRNEHGESPAYAERFTDATELTLQAWIYNGKPYVD